MKNYKIQEMEKEVRLDVTIILDFWCISEVFSVFVLLKRRWKKLTLKLLRHFAHKILRKKLPLTDTAA